MIREFIDIDQELLELIKKLPALKEISYLEEIVLMNTWEGKLYREIAEKTGYQEGYLKEIGSQLWLLLSQELGCQVTKKNLRFILTQWFQLKSSTVEQPSQPAQVGQKREFPDSPLPFGSPLYIKRPPIEDLAIAAINQGGCPSRIKAPQNMGKTSLINQVMGVARQQGMKTVFIDVAQADTEVLGDLDRFPRYFCWNISQQLNLEPKLDDYWFESAGSKLSCTTYLQEYLLNQVEQPIVVAIDKVHYLTEYPNLAQNFLPLLRSWYEKARVSHNWPRLRLIIAHTGELELPLPSHQSPFNVGLPLSLSELTPEQVKDLAACYELNRLDIDDFKTLEPLLKLVGGHPYLLQLAFYWLRSRYLSLTRLLESAPTAQGIYSEHSRRQWLTLQRDERTKKAFLKVLSAPEPIHLDTATAYELEGMGLVKFQGVNVSLRCELYQEYFRACDPLKQD